jgi:hypothetical protein
MSVGDRNTLIHQVLAYDPTIRLVVSDYRSDGHRKVYFKYGIYKILLAPMSTFDSVRKMIENMKDPSFSKLCHLCFEYDKDVLQLGCPECAVVHCELCYYKMFFKDRGPPPCPFCRHDDHLERISPSDCLQTIFGLIDTRQHMKEHMIKYFHAQNINIIA